MNCCDICSLEILSCHEEHICEESGENYHAACWDNYWAEQEAYWRPLYEGEKFAGLTPDPKAPKEYEWQEWKR